MYHYVRNLPETKYLNIKGLLTSKFIGQLEYILANYTVVRLENYIDCLRGSKDIPPNSCVLTFDDGFKDHYINVFPLLKERKITASFFPLTKPLTEHTVMPVHKSHFLLAKVGTKVFAGEFNQILESKYPELVKDYFVDGNKKKDSRYRWDDALTTNLKCCIAALSTQPKVDILNQIFARYFGDEVKFCEELYMNWAEMREMAKDGMSFGSHSHSHASLVTLPAKERIREVRYSKDLLEENIGTQIKSIAYPYGNSDVDLIDILVKEGYTCGVTTYTGINEGSDINPFNLKRLDTNDLPFRKEG